MTAGTTDYPEIIHEPLFHAGMTERSISALERIATALEQLVLQLPLYELHTQTHGGVQREPTGPASPPETAPAERALAPWDNAPMPPAAPYTVGSSNPQAWRPAALVPPLQAAQPYQYQGPPTIAAPFPSFPVWTCPVHHGNKLVPAGVSKRTGVPYDAFLSCTERDCPQKPPR